MKDLCSTHPTRDRGRGVKTTDSTAVSSLSNQLVEFVRTNTTGKAYIVLFKLYRRVCDGDDGYISSGSGAPQDSPEVSDGLLS